MHNIDMGVRGPARDTHKPVVKCLSFYIDPVVWKYRRLGGVSNREIVSFVRAMRSCVCP